MKKLIILSFFLFPLIAYSQDVEIIEEPTEVIKSNDSEDEQTVYEVFDVSTRALFPGDENGLQQYIAQNVKYPMLAIDSGAQGTVNVMFVVNTDGSVSNVTTIDKSKNFGLDEEAMRVISSTSGMWKPAMNGDKAVRLRYRIPIKFQLF